MPSEDQFQRIDIPVNSGEREAVEQQLNQILINRLFSRSRMRASLLRFLVAQALDGDGEISEYQIAINALGRPESFDSSSDSSVRVQMRRLRQALETYYREEGRDDRVSISFPYGSYRPTLTYRGKENKAPRPVQTIAVLPLQNLSADTSDSAHIITGLCEELTSQFALYDRISTLSYYSAAHFAGGGDVRDIGEALGADYLLTGNLARSNDLIRVNLRLVKADSRQVLWSYNYDGDYSGTGLFELQDRIVHETTARIADDYGVIPKLALASAMNRHPEHLQTFEAVALGYQYFMGVSGPTFRNALVALERAVRKEPTHAPALGILSYLYYVDYALDYEHIPNSFGRSETTARKSLAIDPYNAWANFAMAELNFRHQDIRAVRRHCAMIVEGSPNASWMVGTSGWILMMAGDFEKGMDLLTPTLESDRIHPDWLHSGPCLAYYQAGAYDMALEEAEAVRVPDLFWDPLWRCICLAQLGRIDKARQELAKILALAPDFPKRYRHLLECFIFRKDSVDKVIEGLKLAGFEPA